MLQLLDPKKDEIILDVGAGNGYIASQVAKYCDNVYALEPEDKKVEYSKKRFPEVKAFSGNVSSIPFPENYFDKAFTISALHHFPDATSAIDEMVRVLKAEGRLLIHDSNPERSGAKFEAKFKKGVRFLPSSAVREIAETLGFLKVVEVKEASSTYFLLAEKKVIDLESATK